MEKFLNYIIENLKKLRDVSIAECIFKAIGNKNKLSENLKEKLTLNIVNKFKINDEYICKIFSDSDIKEHEKAQLIARLCSDESILMCVNRYKFQSKEQRDDFIYYLKQYNKDFNKVFDLFNNENIPCSLPQNNYEIEKQKIDQSNFDDLFCKSKVIDIIKKIIKDLNSNDISRAKVREHYLNSDYNLPFYIFNKAYSS